MYFLELLYFTPVTVDLVKGGHSSKSLLSKFECSNVASGELLRVGPNLTFDYKVTIIRVMS